MSPKHVLSCEECKVYFYLTQTWSIIVFNPCNNMKLYAEDLHIMFFLLQMNVI